MERATQTLWVEPRRTGFIVTRDPRNPPTRVGHFFPYEYAWPALNARGAAVMPSSSGRDPLIGVRLRLPGTSKKIRTLAYRAMVRDLANRLRAGTVRLSLPLQTRARWLPVVFACGALASAVYAIAIASGPGIVTGIGFGIAALMLLPALNLNVRRISVDGPVLTLEYLDGRAVRRPLSTIAYMTRPTTAWAVLQFTDGQRVFLGPAGASLTLFHALLRGFSPHSRRVDRERGRRALLRAACIYWPLGCVLLGVAHWYLGATNGWYIPGRPVASAVLSAATLCVWLGAVFALQLSQPAIQRLLAERSWRRERSRARRGLA